MGIVILFMEIEEKKKKPMNYNIWSVFEIILDKKAI